MSWLRRYWGHAVAAIGAAIGIVIAILTLGKVRPKRPDIPEAVHVDSTPADDYHDEKVTEVTDVEASINARYK